MDKIRDKYGRYAIRWGLSLLTSALDLDAKAEHIIHSIGFLGTL